MPVSAERAQGFRPLDLLTEEFRLPKPHAEADEGIVRLARSNTVLEHANQLMIEFGPVNFCPFDTKYAPDGVFDPGEYALSTQISTDQGTIHVGVTATYADVPNEKSLGQITGVTLSFGTGEGENAQSSSFFVPRIDLRDSDVAVDEEQQGKEEEELATRALKELPSVADLEKAMHLLFSVVPDALLASGAISNKDNPKVPQGKPTSLLGETPTQVEVLSPAELGKRTYDAITSLTTNLMVLREFTDALGRTFFGRSFPRGRSIIEDGVYFEKGQYGYLIRYHAEPLRFGPEDVRDYKSNVVLTIEKYDPSRKKRWPETNMVASIRLAADFIEDQDGIVKEFKFGSALLNERFEVSSLHHRADPTDIADEAAALDRMPEVFKDFYLTPVKL